MGLLRQEYWSGLSWPPPKDLPDSGIKAAAFMSPANAGDVRDASSIPGSGRIPGGGHDNPLQYSCLENSMDRGAWQAMVHSVVRELDTTEAT